MDTEELFIMSDSKVFQSVGLLQKKILHRMSSNQNEESQEDF